MSDKKKITVYERYYFDNHQFMHNHIINGHIKGDHPKGKSKFQNLEWKMAEGWRITFAYLKNGKVIESESDKVMTYFHSPKRCREGRKIRKI